MSERITVSMVMDASQNDVRRYWTGHDWTTDPLMGVQSQHAQGVAGDYWYLYQNGCSAAHVLVELSYTPERTTVHRIQVWNKVTYDKR